MVTGGRAGGRENRTDWKNVYVRVPNADERLTGAAPLPVAIIRGVLGLNLDSLNAVD